MKVLVGSGWWCNEQEDRDNAFGDKFIRSSEFFNLWIESIHRQNEDIDIFITDSNSPIKPEFDFESSNNITFISLNENGGHAVNHKGFFCGWTRSVIMSMNYCMCGNYDYYVYVEQDALLKGDVIKQAIEEAEKTGAAFGYSAQTAYQLQVSFFVIKQSLLREFLASLYSLGKSDGKIAPENKFSIVLSRLNYLSFLFQISNTLTSKAFRLLNKSSLLRRFSYLSFGYGRERPIDFQDSIFYFQQATKEEINNYLELKKSND